MTPEQIADFREACTHHQVVHANDATKLLDEVERLQTRNARLVALVKRMATCIANGEEEGISSSYLSQFIAEIKELCGEE